MANDSKPKSGGGAGTTAGTTFQEDAACYFCALILSEANAEPPLALPAATRLLDLVAESAQPVDDLVLQTSDGGVLFVQAKNSLSLSDREDSDLASVFDQFVRQFVSGIRFPGRESRPLDGRDRLALVVGPRTPDTISHDLLIVLEKLRHVVDSAGLERAASEFNLGEQKALAVVRTLVQRAWETRNPGNACTVATELTILHFVYVLPLDFSTAGHSAVRAKDLLRSVLPDPDRSGEAWRALIEICRTFGPRRTGGDLEFLRRELERRNIPLSAPRSFRKDIGALTAYTDSRIGYIERLSTLKLDGNTLKINRPAVAELQRFASEGHCAVVGEPGAGKSGCLHDLVKNLAVDHDVVLLTADMVKASSPTELAADLGLTPPHSLVDVLAAWSGEGAGYLVVDALDAARARMSLHVLCEVLRQVTVRAPRWRIVASIREYDLRTSPEVQELFEGAPHEEFADPRFPDVRHLSIKPLTTRELDQLRGQSATLSATFDSVCDRPLADLIQNPFNLSLLCKLLDQTIGQDELNAVKTQVELLDLYWARRIERSDAEATAAERRVVLAAAVNLMVQGRGLHIARGDLDRPSLPAKGTHAVFSDGVLIHVSLPPASGTEAIGFAHNILFDYAVHRLWLDGMSDSIIARLSMPASHDLLLALRPSIVMTFENLWYLSVDHAMFWDRTLALCSSTQMHLVGKIIAPGVAAQEFGVAGDFEPLISQVSPPPSVPRDVLQYTIQAAITQWESNPTRFPITGPTAANWMGLAERLCQRLDLHGWDVRSLLLAASRSNVPFSEQQARNANAAAVASIHAGLSESGDSRWVRPALEVAIDTIAANVPETVNAVRRVLSPEVFRLGGHEWLHSITERIGRIAEHDEQLTLDLVDVAFSVRGSRDDQVPMGGRILPLTMNKHDLLAMGRHDLDKAFSKILRVNPRLGTRMLIRVMTKAIEEKNEKYLDPKSTFRFPFRGAEAVMRPDASYIWTAGEHNRHEDWYKVLTAFKRRLVELGKGGPKEELEIILQVLRDECQRAVVWNAVLDAAASAPKHLAPHIYELLCSPAVLGEIDTRKAAGDAVAAGFAFLSPEQQAAVEGAVLQIPMGTKKELEQFATARRDRIIGCIPRDLIVSPTLRSIREELDSKGGPPPNRADFSISSSWGGGDEHWWLREQGVKPERPENAELLRLSKRLKEAGKSESHKAATSQFAAAQLPLLDEVLSAIQRASASGADEPLIEHTGDELVDLCEKLASAQGLKRNDSVAVFIRNVLRKASLSRRPAYNNEDDARWDKGGASWGSPSPRIDAALGLMRLASSSDLVDAEILGDLGRLAADPVPAVRYQVLCHAAMLYHTAPSLMWSCIEHCCVREERAGIVDHVCANVILRLPPNEFPRLAPLVTALYARSRTIDTFDGVRKACAVFYARAALWDNDEEAATYISDFSRTPWDYPDEANKVIDLCRGLLHVEDDERAPKRPHEVRQWAVKFLSTVVNGLRSQAERLHSTNTGKHFGEWPADDVRQLRSICILAHNAATEVYIGLGAAAADHSDESDPRRPVKTVEEKRMLLRECAPLFSELCDIPFVEAAYDVLQTLECFIEADPLKVVLWVASLVRRAESDGVQYESMAAELVVRIVERYLAEYGPLFRDDSDARKALLDVLGVFVKAGWPGATRLTHRLGEVFR